MNWTNEILEQLTFHWENQVRPNLADLTDDEYLWEPGPDTWSIRPRSEARSAMAAGAGELVADFEFPEPDPAPLTTIAWRLGHVRPGIFRMSNAEAFGGPLIAFAPFPSAHTTQDGRGIPERGQWC